MKSNRFEQHVIVGAGLAGSAAALLLARGGAAPLLLERTAQVEPRICGEFISAEAAHALGALGVDVQALGGRPTSRLRLAAGSLQIEAALPFTAVGLTRHVLDAALQQQAVAAGARLQRGGRVVVRDVATSERPWVLGLQGSAGGDADGGSHGSHGAGHIAGETDGEIATPTLLLACGKTDLAPLARRPKREPEPLVGLQTHLRLTPAQARAIEGHVEVLLFDDGYAGLQPVEGDRVNLCLLMRRPQSQLPSPPRSSSQSESQSQSQSPPRPSLPAMLQALQQTNPLLAERLEGAEWAPGPPQSIYRVPYGHVHRPAADDLPGLWRLGDQAAVIPSFTGDGMAIALHSAALAADELLAGRSPGHYHRRLERDIGAQVARAHALYRFGQRGMPRHALLALLQRWPSLLGFIATMTRVPPSALLL